MAKVDVLLKCTVKGTQPSVESAAKDAVGICALALKVPSRSVIAKHNFHVMFLPVVKYLFISDKFKKFKV